MEESKISTPDFVKVDVEGHEYHVLRGANRLITNSTPILLVEVQRQNLKKVFDYVVSFDSYAIYTICRSFSFKLGSDTTQFHQPYANLMCIPKNHFRKSGNHKMAH
jgi:hypothetical protein